MAEESPAVRERTSGGDLSVGGERHAPSQLPAFPNVLLVGLLTVVSTALGALSWCLPRRWNASFGLRLATVKL